jgi:hypothetical protein
MRWLAVTLVLLVASAALVAGIYLRDRDTATSWLPAQRPAARADALSVAANLGGTCPQRCHVRILSHPRPYHWVAWIHIPRATECVDIDLLTFATVPQRGLSGIAAVSCG